MREMKHLPNRPRRIQLKTESHQASKPQIRALVVVDPNSSYSPPSRT